MKQTTTVGLMLLAVALGSASALSPEGVNRIVSAVHSDVRADARTTDEQIVVLEIDLESDYRGGIASVQTDTGTEYYVSISDGAIHERERDPVSWRDRRIAQEIRENATFLSLVDGYRRTLAYLAEDPLYQDVTEATFRSIEYTVEFGRVMIEVDFEGPFGELEVYLDATDGTVVEAELDR